MTTKEAQTSADVVDAVLTASRTLIAISQQSLGGTAEETTIAQYRALVVLASRGPQRLVDMAAALQVTPSTAGRMCDRLVRKSMIRRHRARADRREVLISITPAGRRVVDQATAARRDLLADILGRLPVVQQADVATALRAFAAAAGEVPDGQWPHIVAPAAADHEQDSGSGPPRTSEKSGEKA